MLKNVQIKNLINLKTNLLHFPKFHFRTEHISRTENFSERKSKSNSYYQPKGLLEFTKGRLPLIDSTASSYIKFLKRQNYLCNFVILTSSSVSLALLITGTYLNSGISLLITALGLYLKKSLSSNLSRVVTHFNLLEDGKQIEVITVKKKFNVDIKVLAKPNKAQLASLKVFNPTIAKMAVPFIVDKGEHKGFYYVVPDVTFNNNKEIISAVMNGSYIKVDETNKIGKVREKV